MDYANKARNSHKEHQGKLEIHSLVPLLNKEDLSTAYTPGVGTIVLDIAEDREKVYEYTMKGRTVLVVSDGSAILGLGNLGAEAALPVMEGKAVLFKQFAGIDAFPICLDTQDTEEIIQTIKHIAPVFGGINIEDISAPRCFEIEERLQKELSIPVMHDDQHGTAVVVLAGLINACTLRNLGKDARIVISGVGSAGVAITRILLTYGYTNIVCVDTKGILIETRTDLLGEKVYIASKTNRDMKEGDLTCALTNAHIFIGVSRGNTVTKEMIQVMEKDPIIFALSNPIPEIMPEDALSAGAYIVASGRSDFPNQLNNALAFPGLFKGALKTRKQFTDELFVKAAIALASVITPTKEAILPSVFDERIVPAISAVFEE